ncbi:MAG: hypothetical protein UV39_C0025G0008 [Candidatus Azambacteria bacterium GW2011_GWA2_42_62]|nr:MAG: hypothetical protein UV39_C0025G0008 [Candidatus Azambacteria bacterium GW2011_GWA2_42_62]
MIAGCPDCFSGRSDKFINRLNPHIRQPFYLAPNQLACFFVKGLDFVSGFCIFYLYFVIDIFIIIGIFFRFFLSPSPKFCVSGNALADSECVGGGIENTNA